MSLRDLGDQNSKDGRHVSVPIADQLSPLQPLDTHSVTATKASLTVLARTVSDATTTKGAVTSTDTGLPPPRGRLRYVTVMKYVGAHGY